MKVTDILKRPISNKPISAAFLPHQKPEVKPLINPAKKVSEFSEKEKEKIEMWLSFCAIGTTILDTGTKALSNMQVIHKRNAIFDLIEAFKQLRKHFAGNKNFDEKEREIDDFMFQFLTGGEEHQKRVIKFQESILNKAK